MGKTLQYVKDFDFSPKNFCVGGMAKKADGGRVDKADLKQDKAVVKVAVHKHEKNMHKGEPLTKLKRGGSVTEAATGEKYPSREAMVKHESKETPSMRRQELVERSKVVAPRRRVPMAPTSPLLALKQGGSVDKGAAKMGRVLGEYKAGDLHSGSKTGPEVTNRKQAVAIAMSEARKARRD